MGKIADILWGDLDAVVDVAIKTEIMLANQERTKDWEYRVISLNTTGEGVPSNTVAAVV